ncbi:concanavalin A-like lectin/glucanase superfamily protein [Archangium gephyra]|uniref:Concanavalin A-like lectin/glucanase superfamily protein n=1 Tax=Archangium gephyra TaxID=48 RepID=A0ABX9KBI5_9BACT|nr:LamG domain-containing protein [Archangium gephyra]REG37538.1 concanavalin A-like lectin/glucanase superfamily protein [Archangium gephyra]
MVRGFAITTSTSSIRLDGSGRGELTFTVSNALGRPVRGRAVVEPEGVTSRDWLALEGEAERDFPPDGTHQYTVRVNVPPGTPQGQHAFHLSVVNVANPDEEFTVGPSASFQVPLPQAPAPRKKLPIAWLALAAGILVIALATFFALRGRGGDEAAQGVGGAGAAGQAEQAPAKQAFLSLDGKGGYVELGNPRELIFFGPITIEAWIRPRSLNGLRNIVVHGHTHSPQAEVYLRINNGKYQVGSFNGQDFSTSADIPTSDVGRWVYLAGVYDGARWVLYRDGEMMASTPHPLGTFFVDGPWAIGARGGGRERFFQGDIRDVRIWNLPRGQQEVRADKDRTFTGNEQGLVGYWPLNEGQDVLARDLSPSKNDGLIRDATWGSE